MLLLAEVVLLTMLLGGRRTERSILVEVLEAMLPTFVNSVEGYHVWSWDPGYKESVFRAASPARLQSAAGYKLHTVPWCCCA